MPTTGSAATKAHRGARHDRALDGTTLSRWKASPISFVEEVLHDPETGKPFVLLRGRASRSCGMRSRSMTTVVCSIPSSVYGAPKKSGKTTLAALIVLVMVLLRNDGRFAEGYCVANDFEQAQSRVFTVIKRIVEVSPLLKGEARITADRIIFPAFDATITAIAPTRRLPRRQPDDLCFDELWGYTSERSTRLWDEMITSPARKISCRLTTTYAGFSGESVLLEDLHKRGMALPRGRSELACWRRHVVRVAHRAGCTVAGRALAGGDAALACGPVAYARMILNEFVSPESKFVDLAAWDACVQPSLVPVVRDRSLAGLGWRRCLDQARQHRVGGGDL